MKIYYSVFDVLERIVNNRNPKADSGWGRLVLTMQDLLIDNDFEIVTSPLEADIEFYVGQPPFYLRPQMHPSIQLSMFETTMLPKLWTESFNQWDAIINPSKWGKQCFEDSGVKVPIYVNPLPINFDKFVFTEHKEEEWTYIAIAVQLLDRKRIALVAELFENSYMPEDTKLILKTIPRRTQQELDVQISEQVHLIQLNLPFDEYYDLLKQSHVSVNPSSGEGFSYLSAESMATGLCTIMTDFSAMRDLLANDYTIGLKNKVTPSDVFTTGGMDAKVDTDDLLTKMLWTYEHKEESLEMGRKSSEWIRQYCSSNKIVDNLKNIFSHLISTIPKSFSLYSPTDPIEKWIHWPSLERSLS